MDSAQRIIFPYTQAWGDLQFGNLTAGGFHAFISEGIAFAVGSIAIAHVPFPARTGLLKHMAVRLRSAPLAVDSTYTIYVGGAATALTVPLLAGASIASVTADVPVPLVADGNFVHVQFTCAAAPGTASTRPAVYLSGDIYG